MSRIKGTKSSAALIVSVVALVAALGGGAVAGVAVTSLSKEDRKEVTKIAKKQGKKQARKQAKKKGFLTGDRILYGRESSGQDEALLFKWPDTGVEIRTHDADAGDAIFELRIVNTNPPGGSSFHVADVGRRASFLAPGDSEKVGGLTGADLLLNENTGSLGRMMRLSCFANVISSGDDGFMQCMGVTAGA